MCDEDVLVLVKATIILDLECVPSLQCLLVGVITTSDDAAGRVKLEFPIIMVATVKRTLQNAQQISLNFGQERFWLKQLVHHEE